ncbi:hypothetical protein SAMN05428989_0343 [Pseudoxanthomonas sp. GM95]|nr:hypothetical protein SAMN05428989_0343 [Pseudoxanthomonas sp. GM95]
MVLSPGVPYADAWRFLAHFLQRGFPADILTPDNGHHELIPNIVRVIELRLFKANQWLQVGSGIAFLLASVWFGWKMIRELPASETQIAGLLSLCIGLFWLGNERALSHANETVHAYSVVLFLVYGIALLTAADLRPGKVVGACACGLAAAFSFGSGIAVFGGFAAVLLVRRAGVTPWLVLITGALLTLVLLHLTGDSSGALLFRPGHQLFSLVSWLSGPAIYVGWPMLDSEVANNLPGHLRGIAILIAAAYQEMFGSVMLPRWPHFLLGLLGGCWYCLELWKAWKAPSRVSSLGLGLSSFALTVAALIAVVRFPYLQSHPDQLLAPRYVVWSSLFWSGLLLALVGRPLAWTRSAAFVLATALLLLPSEVWMWRLAEGLRTTATRNALAATMGIVDAEEGQGESAPGDIAKAIPLLKGANAAMFADQAPHWLGHSWLDSPESRSEAYAESVLPVQNLIGASGRKVTFLLRSNQRRMLLVDPDGVVRGIAMPDPAGRRHQWVGWMMGPLQAGMPRIVEVPATDPPH